MSAEAWAAVGGIGVTVLLAVMSGLLGIIVLMIRHSHGTLKEATTDVAAAFSTFCKESTDDRKLLNITAAKHGEILSGHSRELSDHKMRLDNHGHRIGELEKEA